MKTLSFLSLFLGLVITNVMADEPVINMGAIDKTFEEFGSYSKAKEFKAEVEEKLKKLGYEIIYSELKGGWADKKHTVKITYVAKNTEKKGSKNSSGLSKEESTTVKVTRGDLYLKNSAQREALVLSKAKDWIEKTQKTVEDLGYQVIRVGTRIQVDDSATTATNTFSDVDCEVFIQYMPKVLDAEKRTESLKKLETLSALVGQIQDEESRKLARKLIAELREQF